MAKLIASVHNDLTRIYIVQLFCDSIIKLFIDFLFISAVY